MVVGLLLNFMTEKLILLLMPIKCRKIDINRYEIKEYEKIFNYKVEIHELINFLHPGFEKSFMNNVKDKRLKSFYNFKKWKEYYLKLKIKYGKNILIIKNISNNNLISLKLNLFLKKNNAKIIEYSTNQFPINQEKKNFFNLIENLVYSLFFNPRKIVLYFLQNFLIFIGKLLNLFPTYLIKTGSKSFAHIKFQKNIKIINGNSFDYNMYLKSKIKKTINKNYGLFLEAPTPLFSGDIYIDGEKSNARGTPEKWFPSLDKFFTKIEKLKKIKIMIVPHPKIKHKKNKPNYYFGRKIVSESLANLAKNSSVIISRDSAGFSYAAIHNKPAIFIYTNELLNKKNFFLNNQRFFASELGLNPINIDNYLNDKNLEQLFKFDKKKYHLYVKQYLTSRNDKKSNCELIGKLI